MPQIQEVFGQFAVQLDKVVMFDTREEAATALSAHENGAEQRAEAEAYCAANDITGRAAVSKANTIIAFLQFRESLASAPVEADPAPAETQPTQF